ncbi:IQ domain-containing calmodulin-binding protein [Kwoniella heveanensis BCC8398]|uniref:IQ domain-containing calmodulin-binding protein n=1 Tax=Kwoniella heveanensis BCC8398 TaxID=1296120 RepID=A0A1B9GH88_9TREE|nr:IQ domain-containing calmodulin-binding protein [Kwoniella heveanensis BCC8398]
MYNDEPIQSSSSTSTSVPSRPEQVPIAATEIEPTEPSPASQPEHTQRPDIDPVDVAVTPKHQTVGNKIKSAVSVTLGRPITHGGNIIKSRGGADDEGNAFKEEREYDESEKGRREDAARSIQRYYRGYKDRQRVKGMKLQRDARWDDLVKQTGEKTYAQQQLDNKNDVVSRWHRAAQAASRLQSGQGVYDPPTELTEEIPGDELPPKVRKSRRATFWGSLSMGVGKERDENATLPFQSKALEQQHWLEMIDGKHRYGSNMKFYFRKWKEAETQDNFFRWLDRGEGKDLDLEEMPRERLEKERITYLSAEQRLNYLVKVDKDGLLRWARNNELVDTAAGKWRDSGEGKGIIPDEGDDTNETSRDTRPVAPGDPYASTSKTPWQARRARPRTGEDADEYTGSDSDSGSSASYSASSDLDDNEDTHYVGLDKEEEEKGWLAKRTKKYTPGGMRKELLRKTVRRNTWIYVSDMNLNLFVGIKKSGTFQHSSFLAGGKVTSAGIIVVNQGLIKSLNPLSGHYRSSIEHYRAFIGQLENRGVDLSHVKIAKSVLSLWGLSRYAQVTKKEQNLMTHLRRALHLSHEATEEEKSAKLQKNAEREEREHQERMRAVKEAEREGGFGDERTLAENNAVGENDHDEQIDIKHCRKEREQVGEGGAATSVRCVGTGKMNEEDEEEVRAIRRRVLYGRENKR